MAGSNAVPFKRAFQALLKTALATAGINGIAIRVDDAYNGKLAEREYVYFGHITGPHEPFTFRSGARLPRQETLTVNLHVEAAVPGGSTFDSDTRIVAIGQLVEETLANDPLLGGAVAGLLGAWMSHTELTSFYMEDGVAASAGVFQISVLSKLG